MTLIAKAGSAIVLPAEIELSQVADHHAALLAKCKAAKASKPLMLDLTEGTASAPALQLIIAARKSLELRGAFGGFGQQVGPLLAHSTATATA